MLYNKQKEIFKNERGSTHGYEFVREKKKNMLSFLDDNMYFRNHY